MAAVAIIIIGIFVAGAAAGIVVIVSLGIRREERDLTLTGRAPDRKSQGARSLTGLYVRQRSDSSAFFTAPVVRAEPAGTTAGRQRGAGGLNVRPPAARSGEWPRAAPCQRRPVGDGCPHPRRGNHRIFGDDLLHRHPGGEAIEDHAHRHPGTGEHSLPVHHLRIGGDQLQLLSDHTPVCPVGGKTATTGPTLTTHCLATQPTACTGPPVSPPPPRPRAHSRDQDRSHASRNVVGPRCRRAPVAADMAH